MADPRRLLLDSTNAVIQTAEPRTIEPDRATAFFIPELALRETVPPMPSLYHYVTTAFTGIGEGRVPKYIAEMEMLGKLIQLSPLDGNMMMATFNKPDGHPSENPSDEQAPVLSIPVTATVTDAFVNSGTLMGLDNIVYGHAEDGVLYEVAIFIEVG